MHHYRNIQKLSNLEAGGQLTTGFYKKKAAEATFL